MNESLITALATIGWVGLCGLTYGALFYLAARAAGIKADTALVHESIDLDGDTEQ